MTEQLFESLKQQNEITHALLSEMRRDLKAHYKEDEDAWKKLAKIETTMANAGWMAGALVAVVGIVIGIIQMVR